MCGRFLRSGGCPPEDKDGTLSGERRYVGGGLHGPGGCPCEAYSEAFRGLPGQLEAGYRYPHSDPMVSGRRVEPRKRLPEAPKSSGGPRSSLLHQDGSFQDIVR